LYNPLTPEERIEVKGNGISTILKLCGLMKAYERLM